VAIHGITASSLAFQPVATACAGPVLVPDLRGRGGSARLAGPFGIGRHADDVVALMDDEDLDRVTLVGHSMGAYVAAVLAARRPERIARVVLIDGGLTVRALPPGTDTDALLATALGPALARLDQTFPSVDDYLAMWRAHPSFQDWEPFYDDYFTADLDAGGRPLARRDAVLADGGSLLLDPEVHDAPRLIGCPTTLVWAERGLLDQPEPFIDLDTADRYVASRRDADFVQLAGTNHYTVMMAAGPAIAVAGVISGLA
jgi:pimeloyl-ACP methyl ester carboxylesterase